MKLLFCNICEDIRPLHISRTVVCFCNQSSGRYEKDGLHAWISGPCDVLGITNDSFLKARIDSLKDPVDIPGAPGYRFTAFFIPEVAPTVERVD